MSTIIVEDGSIVADANSYVDVAYLDSYAADRGLVIPTVVDDKNKFLILAFDYLEGRRSDYNGSKVTDGQKTQWPRKFVEIDCVLIEDDEIPEELKKAQCQLVVEQQKRTLLYPRPRTSTVEGFVTQKTVGPLTKKFSSFGTVTSNEAIRISSVEVFLKALTSKCCSGPWKRTIRA